jgi:DNA-binding SARP family transcriptional activator
MSALRVCLLGRLSVCRNDHVVPGFDARKVQELFGYLLLNRGRPQSREALAGVLWGDAPAPQSRRYLRQALWQLQTALDGPVDRMLPRLLKADSEWIEIDPAADLWLDVEAFERAFEAVERVPGRELGVERARVLEEALELYQGELLAGCHRDWCLYERERLRDTYLTMLDKLMGHCETHHEYEAGLAYGARILRHDRASERTHWRMMRLQYLAGDRTAALRQYARCIAALEEELHVRPSRRTQALCEQIRTGGVEEEMPPPRKEAPAAALPPPDLQAQMQHLLKTLNDIQRSVGRQLRAVEVALKERR